MGWFLPWLLIAGVVAAAVWVLVMTLGGDETLEPPPAADESSPAASPTPTETEVAVATPTPVESKTPEPAETRPDKAKPLITEGINVQVLNSTADTSVDDAMAERLTGLGFTVEAIDDASRAYEQTVVFWSFPEAQKAAERLAARFGWDVEAKPENLSETVALHVVVGLDET